MDRRQFIRKTSLAIGIGAYGTVNLKGGRYQGDSITTTDILGPFYRPGAPFREILNPPDFRGQVLHISGKIVKDDGRTPLSDGLIEVWQADNAGVYDNISDDYIYRASQRIAKDGTYHFSTTKPGPEAVDEKAGVFRPAHIHMLISAEGQQDLITQIYFENDPYLATDPSTKSGLAINRILTVRKNGDQENEIQFNIQLSKEYLPEDDVFHRISGIYKMNDGALMEFYRSGDLLFYKTNGQIWGGLAYHGNNTFGGKENDTEARFELQRGGGTKVWFRFSRRRETRLEGTKVLMYKKDE